MARITAKKNGHASRIVYVALVGNALVAVSKFSAAAITGSSAMLSEGFHSVVDITNEILLLYGLHRADARPDDEHPLGYGREIYFWSFVVALLIFTAGAGASFYEGVTHIMHPEPVRDAHVTYIVLALAAVFEGVSWVYTLHKFRKGRPYAEVFRLVVHSKDPPTFIVLLEDSAALAGILIAFLGVHYSVTLQRPELDGIASLCIGATLALTAMLLARETKGLLIGEAADRKTRTSMLQIAGSVHGVVRANGVLTVHVSPGEIVAAMSIEFEDALHTPEIEQAVIELERRISRAHPEVISVSVKPQTPRRYRQAQGRTEEAHTLRDTAPQADISLKQ